MIFFPGNITDLKILQSDWPTAFWPISQETDFFQIWDLCKKKKMIKTFIPF